MSDEVKQAGPWSYGDKAEEAVAAESVGSTESEIDRIEREIQDVNKGGKQTHFNFMDQLQQQLQPKPHHSWFNLYSEDELATAFGVKALTLGKWRRDGEGPAYVPVGKQAYYRHDDVVDWLKAKAKKAEPDPRAVNAP